MKGNAKFFLISVAVGFLLGVVCFVFDYEISPVDEECKECLDFERRLEECNRLHSKKKQEEKTNRLAQYEHVISVDGDSYWIKENRWIDRGESEYEILKANPYWQFTLADPKTVFTLRGEIPTIKTEGNIATLLNGNSSPVCFFSADTPVLLEKMAGWSQVHEESEIAKVIDRLEEGQRKGD